MTHLENVNQCIVIYLIKIIELRVVFMNCRDKFIRVGKKHIIDVIWYKIKSINTMSLDKKDPQNKNWVFDLLKPEKEKTFFLKSSTKNSEYD